MAEQFYQASTSIGPIMKWPVTFYTTQNGIKTPAKSHPTDAAFDLFCPIDIAIPPHAYRNIDLGICLQLPLGFHAEIHSRSSTFKRGAIVSGIVDNGYRGEVGVGVINAFDTELTFGRGDRIAQMIFIRDYDIYFQEADYPYKMRPSERGVDGFGSTGR